MNLRTLNSITFIWPHTFCQLKLDFLGVHRSIIARDSIQVLKEENSPSCVHVLKRRINFTSLRALCLKEFVPNDVTHEQCCCLAPETNFILTFYLPFRGGC